MTRRGSILVALRVLLCIATLVGCGGGNVEDDEPAQMPCKYRPDCSVGPPLAS